MSKLLERAKKAQDLSDRAAQLAHDSFNNASKMLSTFENFERVHELNMQAAEEATKLIADIQINLNECRIGLDQASGTLIACKMDNAKAVEDIENVNLLVESAVPVSSKLEEKIGSLKPKQTELTQVKIVLFSFNGSALYTI